MKKIIISIFIVLQSLILAKDDITWDALKGVAPKSNVNFPELTHEEKEILKFIAHMREDEDNHGHSHKHSHPKEDYERVNEYETKLKKQGIDVDEALEARKKLIDNFKNMTTKTTDAFNGQDVHIGGYLIPIVSTQEKAPYISYISPEVVICAHSKIPQGNQIIKIYSNEKIVYSQSENTIVIVKGKFDTYKKIDKLRLSDKTKEAYIGYQIEASSIEK